MKMNVYSIYDAAAKAFLQPFFMHTDGQAVRAFQDNTNGQDNMIAAHPDQFTLFRVGTFDDQQGSFTNEAQAINLGLASRYVTKKTETATLDIDIKRIQEKVDNMFDLVNQLSDQFK